MDLFPTFITDRIAGALETIQKTSDFGLIFSAAGLGKTSGLTLYRQSHPRALAITATKAAADASAIESALFHVLDLKSPSRRTRRWHHLIDHLRDTDRLLLIDNGQRLRTSALQWLFDFHDLARVPIAIFGNPEVLTQIRRNDQMFSRIGLKDEITLPTPPPTLAATSSSLSSSSSSSPQRLRPTHRRTLEQLTQVVDQLLTQLVPDWPPTIRPLALQVAWQRGHFRALRKTLTLAQNLSLNRGPLADPTTAFKAAHLKLVRDYALEDHV